MAVTVALPVFCPKQPTLVCAKSETLSPLVGSVMVTLRVVLQPLASFTVAAQVPAGKLLAVVPFCRGVVFQVVLYGAVPPLMEIPALPVVLPKQSTLVCAASEVLKAAVGPPIVTLAVAGQL